jgi:hypothetical protein
MSVKLTSEGESILVYNVVYLLAPDFIGILQIPLQATLLRFLTFFITFFGSENLPIPFLRCIFLASMVARVRYVRTDGLQGISMLELWITVPVLHTIGNTNCM